MKRTVINKKSSKQNSIDIELHSIYQDMAINKPHRCTGCGRNNGLTHSHLIPRSRSRELICDPNNITYHCMNCHKKWENGLLADEMTDFTRNMNYIKTVDEQYFHIKQQKLEIK
jgi:5-methylcytosine-specific restriction endonuclease McrA|tara:strand:- start:6556 stop:6897 length:342 start_codon:yes stop_codon:yes gene_type:complete